MDKMEKIDNVNSPKHYTQHPSGVECQDIRRHLPSAIADAVKYLWRAGLKSDEVEDLKKAIWYINDYLKNPITCHKLSKSWWDDYYKVLEKSDIWFAVRLQEIIAGLYNNHKYLNIFIAFLSIRVKELEELEKTND